MPPPRPGPPERRERFEVAVALGANLGDPAATLAAVRPLLEAEVGDWWEGGTAPRARWSPRFHTAPVGGPTGQPPYLNAAVLFAATEPPAGAPLPLLRRLQALEERFGRRREVRWGPRHLDLDLLWCGAERVGGAELELPHPRLHLRSFVLAPLAAIDPDLAPPAAAPSGASGQRWERRGCGQLLAALLPRLAEPPPQRLPPAPGWPE